MLMEAHFELLSPVCAVAARVLLLADPSLHRKIVLDVLAARGYEVTAGTLSGAMLVNQTALPAEVGILLVDVTNAQHNFLNTLEALYRSIANAEADSRLLCFSFAHRNPRFELAIKQCGARYVRVTDPSVLVDTIDLALAE